MKKAAVARCLGIAVLTGGALSMARTAQAECAESESKPRHGQFFEDWFLSEGVCLVEDHGKSVLSDVAKDLAGMALEAIVPGSASIFGLGGGDDKYAEWSTKIMDLIVSEAEGINDHIDDFWAWMRDTQNAQMASNFAAVQDGILLWNTMTTDEKLWQVATLNAYVDDLNALRHGMANVVEPIDRLRWLHSYTEVVDLSLALVAEQAMLAPLLPYSVQIQQAGGLAQFRNGLTVEERQEIEARVAFNTRERWEVILHSGAAPVFSVLATIRDAFDEIARERFGDPVQCVGGLPTSWSYTLDNSSDLSACDGLGPDCNFQASAPSQIGPVECNRYTRVYAPELNLFRSTLAESPVDGSKLDVVHAYHRWLTFGDMLLDGYGPVRRKMDAWWSRTRSGYRPYQAADRDLDMFLDGQSPQDADLSRKDPYRGALTDVSFAAMLFATYCTGPEGQESRKRSIAIGYALEHGAQALLEVCAATLEDPLVTGWRPFEVFAELMLSTADPRDFFREQFAAKASVVL